jgi:GntR family transcriptional regulator, transcriptional repressor for pyruvate dehydrogenase complex
MMNDLGLEKRLKSVKELTIVDRVEIKLRNFFNNENLQPGDAIPKEVELAKAMGVSRTAIREALTRLKLLGLIDSRKNRGMIVTRPDVLSNIRRVLDPHLLDGNTMKEIFELRLVLEMGIADILFIKKTDGKILSLEEIVEREERTKNKVERVKIDVEFHSMLYEMSENNTILQFQKMLLPVFDYVNNGLHVRSQVRTKDYASHRVLLSILQNGTPEEFRNKMKSHLMQYFEKV